MILLANNKLALEIASPGIEYAGSRFDWTGYIMQVSFGGKHVFCTKNSLVEKPGREGEGICNEFGIDMPVGYEDIPAGAFFPKIGIGLLKKKNNGPYSFEETHEIQPCDFNQEEFESSAIFFAKQPKSHGYAYNYKKGIYLNENGFEINYTLVNTGDKPLITNEYAHNFLSFDKTPVNEHYFLEFLSDGFKLQPEDIVNPEETLMIKNNRCTFKRSFNEIIFFSSIKDSEQCTGWKLKHLQKNIQVTENVSFAPGKVNLWCDSHVISPELYIPLTIQPGEEMVWTRKYTIELLNI
jgi:hypothetical protein